jgi:uncharacterized membrane protein
MLDEIADSAMRDKALRLDAGPCDHENRPMLSSLDAVFAATVLFVGGHFLLSSEPLRRPLVKWLGAQGFVTVYSLAVTGALLWMSLAYRSAELLTVWTPPPELRWIPLVLLVPASVLVVCAFTTRSPTLVGGERFGSSLDDPAPGIMRITRHPFLWGVTLWAASHLLVNGDLASMTVFGGLLVLCLGGMRHIDMKREASMGAEWGPVKLTTSAVPFAALIAGRTRMDWAGIGWGRPLAGLVLYLALLYGHPWLVGVHALPI